MPPKYSSYYYFGNEQNAVDPELQAIQSVVSNIKNDEEVGEHYMTWDDVIQYEKRDSYEEGRKSGIYEGQVSGFISASREFGKSNEEIIQMLIDNFSLTKEEAINKVTPN